MFNHAFYDLINLFVVFNPTGIIPQYLYFTEHVAHKDRRTLAIRCVSIGTNEAMDDTPQTAELRR